MAPRSTEVYRGLFFMWTTAISVANQITRTPHDKSRWASDRATVRRCDFVDGEPGWLVVGVRVDGA